MGGARAKTSRAQLADAMAAIAIVVAACTATASPTPSPSTPTPPFPADPDSARLRAEAVADLARWAEAVAAGRQAMGFVPVGPLSGQTGDWEQAVAGNNKIALMSGAVEATVPMPSDQPPDGRLRWPDGTSTSVPLVSAAMALEEIKADGQPCPECQPLRVTAARLTERPIETSRGRTVVPTWAFAIAGSAVEITRVAVASRVTPIMPSVDPNDPPIGISIEQAWLAPDGRTLSVGFTSGCNEADRAEAVESELAVAVIIHVVHTGPDCARLMGYSYTVTVVLARPLADRAVLEVRYGQPVPVAHVAAPH